MVDRYSLTTIILLALAATAQGASVFRARTGYATLPIFVPVSLEYERQMRSDRQQPAGKGGEEANDLVRELLSRTDVDPALAPQIAALKVQRDKLLDARNRRHALNIALMDVGVAVTTQLTPSQWDRIHMQRDAIRGKSDAAVFARVMEKLK